MQRGLPLATLIAARILGPLLLAYGVLCIAQRARVLSMLESFIDDDNLLMLGGTVSLVLGLALVALHDYWRALTPALVSILGWLAIVRGVGVLFAPNLVRNAGVEVLTHPQLVPMLGCVLALLGLWLAFVGFTGQPEYESDTDTHPDLGRF